MRKWLKAALILAMLGLGLVLALPALLPRLQWSTKRLPPPLDAYPDRQALGAVARWHLERTFTGGRKPDLILSWCRSSGTLNWEGIVVEQSGIAHTFRYLHGFAVQGGSAVNPGLLKAEQLRDEFGPASPHPPHLTEVLIVSFEKDGQWQTRLYDRRRLPEPLSRFIEFAYGHDGERIRAVVH